MKNFFFMAIVLALLTACGGAKSLVKVQNNSEGTQTTISVSGVNGGSTSVSVTPDVDVTVKLNPLEEEQR